MYNYGIKTSFVSPKIPKARFNKTCFNIIIVHFYIRRKLDLIIYDTCFLVWRTTGSHPAAINRFRKHKGKAITIHVKFYPYILK